LSTLIHRHQRELFTFIFYKINDEDLANDVFQDTFMKIIIMLKEGRYNEEGKFILWAKELLTILLSIISGQNLKI
jgi:RNA polymerase sigma-70 factor (ECF subfamily)